MKGNGCFYLGNGRFETREMTLPALGEQDVLIRNMACGVCGTDVHIMLGEKGSADVTPPVVLGHEYSGVVLEVGKQVDTVHPGDCVTVDPNIYCGRCRFCRNGQKQFCEHLFAIGVNRDGGFAQLSVAPQSQVFPMNPEIGFESMAMTEPVACCLHGVNNAGLLPGDTALVIGGGAIGQIMAQLLRLKGAGQVIVSEPVAMRRELALSLGADGAIDPALCDLPGQLATLTGRTGADVIVECVGIPAAARQAFELADRGARITLFSVPKPGAEIPLPLMDVFKKELRISGSFINPDTHQAAAALLSAGRLNVKPLITHRFPLAKTAEAIEAQRGAESVKVIVEPNR